MHDKVDGHHIFLVEVRKLILNRDISTMVWKLNVGLFFVWGPLVRKVDKIRDSTANTGTLGVDCWCCLHGFWKVEELTLAAWKENLRVRTVFSMADNIERGLSGLVEMSKIESRKIRTDHSSIVKSHDD